MKWMGQLSSVKLPCYELTACYAWQIQEEAHTLLTLTLKQGFVCERAFTLPQASSTVWVDSAGHSEERGCASLRSVELLHPFTSLGPPVHFCQTPSKWALLMCRMWFAWCRSQGVCHAKYGREIRGTKCDQVPKGNAQHRTWKTPKVSGKMVKSDTMNNSLQGT